MEKNLSLEPDKECRVGIPFRELIGALAYVANSTRPDVAFSVNFFSRFQNGFNESIFNHLKRVVRYLKGTPGYCVKFEDMGEKGVQVFCDADWAGDRLDRKSTTGFVIFGLL